MLAQELLAAKVTYFWDKSGEKYGVGWVGVSANPSECPARWTCVEILKNLFRLAAEGFGSRIGPWDSSDEI
jgi:hypothetical protein